MSRAASRSSEVTDAIGELSIGGVLDKAGLLPPELAYRLIGSR